VKVSGWYKGGMKSVLSALFLILSSIIVFAGDGTFVTQVIHDSDQPFSVYVPSNRFMRITNFIQEGATNPATNGVIYVFQGAPSLLGARILYSTQAGTTHQPHEDLYLGGPIVVYIAPVPNLTLVLSYLRGSN
jgi:hypothetical protein